MKPIALGQKRELFVDGEMFIDLGTTRFCLHQPEKKELAIFRDTVADNSATSYYSIIFNGEKYIMYYTAHGFGQNKAGNWPHQHICRAESTDGRHWVKPNYGIYEFRGTKENNIVFLFDEDLLDNFYAIYDTNPACKEEERYKAVGERVENGVAILHGAVSPDGIHWTDIGTIITKGTFDSLNTFYYDEKKDEYRAFVRGWSYHRPSRHLGETPADDIPSYEAENTRNIMTATSKDFRTWTEPQPLCYGNAPEYQLYTNNIAPYYRAPHILFGFPTRYYDRPWTRCHGLLPRGAERAATPESRASRGNTAFTDGLFMTSRDGENFHRFDDVPFFPSGIEAVSNWVYGDAYPAHGMVETDSDNPGEPREISMFAPDTNANAIRRYTIRLDGFVSLHATYPETEIVSKPFVCEGSALEFNYRSTVSGGFYVALTDEYDNPYEGFSYKDADEMFGDTVARDVSWKNSTDLSALRGKTVKMRIRIRECDLFSFRIHD